MSSVTAKYVYLNIDVGNQLASHEVAKEGVFSLAVLFLSRLEHLTPLESAVVLISQGVTTIYEEINYYKIRERASRDTNESTNSRVMWWSLAENAVGLLGHVLCSDLFAKVLVGLSIWKVIYLRSLFDRK